ncbi:MAG TPA: HupE/UreJ family protein [Bryobacteraceae bacterium]|nr:HupE/UreJ family protein [Bryobacteraceae bacterium]
MEAIIHVFRSRVARITGVRLLLFFASTLAAAAHDIPNDVTAQLFIKPAGEQLNVLVRVPLKSIRDVVFPQRGNGYLDLDRAAPMLPDLATLWVSDFIELYEDAAPLPKHALVKASRVALESDRSFVSYDAAVKHFLAPPLASNIDVAWDQALLDLWFKYPLRSERSRFSIHTALARLGVRVVTVVRFVPPGGEVRALEFTGDPGLIRLDPHWYQAAATFIELGFFHILDGTDHLLFLFCLVIPLRRFRALIPVVTSFTVAHSITLIASAYDLGPSALWFPPLIELLIAISIVYMALENIVGGRTIQHRWMLSFGFGLVHGFGFSFALRQSLQFAGSHLAASLVAFNIGVELGQLLVLLLMIPLLELLFRFVVAERMGVIILSALAAHTGWHWMLERANRLSQYRVEWPEWNAAFAASLMRYLMIAVALAGLGWWVASWLKRRQIVRTEARQQEF